MRILFVILMVAFLLLYRIGLDQGFYINMFYKLIFELEITPL